VPNAAIPCSLVTSIAPIVERVFKRRNALRAVREQTDPGALALIAVHLWAKNRQIFPGNNNYLKKIN